MYRLWKHMNKPPETAQKVMNPTIFENKEQNIMSKNFNKTIRPYLPINDYISSNFSRNISRRLEPKNKDETSASGIQWGSHGKGSVDNQQIVPVNSVQHVQDTRSSNRPEMVRMVTLNSNQLQKTVDHWLKSERDHGGQSNGSGLLIVKEDNSRL